jgi:hypothetical protein
MDCRTNLSWAKNSTVGKSKNRFFDFIIVNRNAARQRKGMEIATFLVIAAGQFSLRSCWPMDGIWAFPSGFPKPFKN